MRTLEQAIQRNRINAVERLLDAGCGIEEKFGFREETALILSAREGHLEITEMLINAKANVDAKENLGNTPLIWSVMVGHQEIADVLINARANLEAKNTDGYTPLLQAANMEGNTDCVMMLLSANSDINAQTNEGMTFFHSGILKMSMEEMKLILASKHMDNFNYSLSEKKFGLSVFDMALQSAGDTLGKFQLLQRFYTFPQPRFVDYFALSKIAELASGMFGIVYKALLKVGTTRVENKTTDVKITVVCKISKIEAAENEWHELQVLQNIPFHMNVVGLLAMCTGFHSRDTASKVTAIIINHKSGGALLQHLQRKKERMKLKRLIRFGLDMAKSLRHFHNNGYRHADVAARNFLLNEKEVDGTSGTQKVCLTDFGLSRPIEHKFKKSPPLPFRWVAPEVYDSYGRIMTTKNDVWMMGITFFEMCAHPYREPFKFPFVGSKELRKYLKSGKHLYCPEGSGFYSKWKGVIMQCCDLDAEKRPTSEGLLDILQKMHGNVMPQSAQIEDHEIEAVSTGDESDGVYDPYDSVEEAPFRRGDDDDEEEAYVSVRGYYKEEDEAPISVRRYGDEDEEEVAVSVRGHSEDEEEASVSVRGYDKEEEEGPASVRRHGDEDEEEAAVSVRRHGEDEEEASVSVRGYDKEEGEAPASVRRHGDEDEEEAAVYVRGHSEDEEEASVSVRGYDKEEGETPASVRRHGDDDEKEPSVSVGRYDEEEDDAHVFVLKHGGKTEEEVAVSVRVCEEDDEKTSAYVRRYYKEDDEAPNSVRRHGSEDGERGDEEDMKCDSEVKYVTDPGEDSGLGKLSKDAGMEDKEESETENSDSGAYIADYMDNYLSYEEIIEDEGDTSGGVADFEKYDSEILRGSDKLLVENVIAENGKLKQANAYFQNQVLEMKQTNANLESRVAELLRVLEEFRNSEEVERRIDGCD